MAGLDELDDYVMRIVKDQFNYVEPCVQAQVTAVYGEYAAIEFGSIDDPYVPILNGLQVKAGDQVIVTFLQGHISNPVVIGFMPGYGVTGAGGAGGDGEVTIPITRSELAGGDVFPIKRPDLSGVFPLKTDDVPSLTRSKISDFYPIIESDLDDSLQGKIDEGFIGPPGPKGKGYDGLTSSTSITIGTGNKSFTVNQSYQSNAYILGDRVRIIADPDNYMEGTISYYYNTNLIVDVDYVSGSGTFDSWVFSITGNVGSTGEVGPIGPPGPAGSVPLPITRADLSGGDILPINRADLGNVFPLNANDIPNLTRSKISDLLPVADSDLTAALQGKIDNPVGVLSGLSGATIRIPVLIEVPTFSNVSYYTVTGLNGDNDGEYQIIFDITVPGSTDRIVYFLPTSASASDFWSQELAGQSGTGKTIVLTGYGFIIIPNFYGFGRQIINMQLLAKTGVQRTSFYNRRFIGPGPIIGNGSSTWNNTTLNLTGFTIQANSGNISGTIKIYKMVDVTIA